MQTKTWMTTLAISTILLVPAAGEGLGQRPMAPLERAYSAFSEDPFRQFDFWIGTWSVRLQARQADLGWKDLTESRASIYSILEGRAILELWDSEPIKGYSLRYWDAATDQWVLWLNWPGKNRSSNGMLGGGFEHGRGEFSASYTNDKGEDIVARYSFNDITPFSLRWDDLHSKDGGKTLSPNWIMHFDREQVEPEWPIEQQSTPTYTNGSRCDAGPFRAVEAVAGNFTGSYVADGREFHAAARGYRVLDGCAAMIFFDIGADGSDELYVFRTWVTAEQRYEDQLLRSARDEVLERYFGDDPGTLVSGNGHQLQWRSDEPRLNFRRLDNSGSLLGEFSLVKIRD